MQRITIVVFILTLLLSTSLMAQATGDYRTNGSGNWSSTAIWQQYNGSSWVAASAAPTGSETITVLSADSVFVDAALSISGTLINQGVVELESEEGLYRIPFDRVKKAHLVYRFEDEGTAEG